MYTTTSIMTTASTITERIEYSVRHLVKVHWKIESNGREIKCNQKASLAA